MAIIIKTLTYIVPFSHISPYLRNVVHLAAVAADGVGHRSRQGELYISDDSNPV